jgi:hypothetical protein
LEEEKEFRGLEKCIEWQKKYQNRSHMMAKKSLAPNDGRMEKPVMQRIPHDLIENGKIKVIIIKRFIHRKCQPAEKKCVCHD